MADDEQSGPKVPSHLKLMSEQETAQVTAHTQQQQDSSKILDQLDAGWELEEVKPIEKKEYIRKTTCPKCHFDQPEPRDGTCAKCGVAMLKYAQQLQKQLAIEAGEDEDEDDELEMEDAPATFKERIQEGLTNLFGSDTHEEMQLAKQAGLLKENKKKRRKKESKTPTAKTTTQSHQKIGITNYETIEEDNSPKQNIIGKLKSKATDLLGDNVEAQDDEQTLDTAQPEALQQGIISYEDMDETATPDKTEQLAKSSTNEEKTIDTTAPSPVSPKPKEKKKSLLGTLAKRLNERKQNKNQSAKKQPVKKPKSIKTPDQKDATPEIEIPPPTGPQQEYALFIGQNIRYYLAIFDEFPVIDESGQEIDEFTATWNWPAFYIPFIWFLYRKQYLFSLLSLLSMILPLFTNIAWAISANYFYYLHAKRKIDVIKSETEPSQLGVKLKAAGGVHKSVAISGIIILMLASLSVISYSVWTLLTR